MVEAFATMDHYADYCLEDFVLDARFQRWVRYPSPDEETFWHTFLAQHPQQTQEIERARTLLQSVYRRYESQLSDSEIDLEIQKLIARARASKESSAGKFTVEEESPAPKIISFRGQYGWLLRAASVVLVLGVAGWLWLAQSPKSAYDQRVAGQSLTEHTNHTRTRQLIRLADGSKVTLEPNARLSYPAQFSASKRQVYLSGTAFFDVAKDAKRPFLVYANELVTKVLGTSFIVRAPDRSARTIVEVKEGRVSVMEAANSPSHQLEASRELTGLILTANQKVIFEREQDRMVKTLRDTPEIVPSASQVPTFQFKDTPISEVLTELEQAYQVDILFDKEVLSHCPLTATLTDQPLFEKLTVICEAIGAHYEVLDGQIVVDSKGCK
ncbi:FecR family protein [Spirosoma panaciterrae]|uniref:FecR family protein n=1 Tax=Spirosoma panaciterrae TaxID=496058 RepID=UPI0003828517|nr:FecR family protein [Spirosoma panaciterrae]